MRPYAVVVISKIIMMRPRRAYHMLDKLLDNFIFTRRHSFFFILFQPKKNFSFSPNRRLFQTNINTAPTLRPEDYPRKS